MLLLFLKLFSTLALLAPTVYCDSLVQAHVLWRHGDRTPLNVYPNDPYRPFWNQFTNGELTTIGMKQCFVQGVKTSKRLFGSDSFINNTYQSSQTNFRSVDEDRFIQSASSFFAGFYSNSANTRPQVPGWPNGYLPVPIHSIPKSLLLDPTSPCPRMDEIIAERTKNPAYIDFIESHADVFEVLSTHSGYPLRDESGLGYIFDCARIEKDFRNWTLPSWFTDNIYKRLYNYQQRTGDYLYGEADFGLGENVEMKMLRGGVLLDEILSIMNDVVSGVSNNNIPFYAYSAHDTTLSSLLRALGAKPSVIKWDNPPYASVLTMELWKARYGYYIKIGWSADENTSFRDITQFVDGCTQADTCPFDIFVSRSRPYIPKDIQKQCGFKI